MDYPELILVFISILVTLFVSVVGLWIRTMKTHIEKHVTKEEEEMWPKIEQRFNDFDNKLHSLELNMSTRMTALEVRIPNGDIREMKAMLEVLIKR